MMMIDDPKKILTHNSRKLPLSIPFLGVAKNWAANFEIILEEGMEMEVVHLVVDDDWWQYRVTHTHTHTHTHTNTNILTPKKSVQ